MHLRDVNSFEESGTLDGLGLRGTFEEWKDGERDKRVEVLGIRTTTTLRIGERTWEQDENGAVREFTGIQKRRQITDDFLSSDAFSKQPQYSTYEGTSALADGRKVYELDVKPPGGETFRVDIDAANWLIDRVAYDDEDAQNIATYSDDRVTDGMLISYTEVDSNGDTPYDVTVRTTSVKAGVAVASSIFAPLVAQTVTAQTPVSIGYDDRSGEIVIPLQRGGKTYHFLLDSGSQSDVIDPSVVTALGIHAEGTLEVSGAKRTSSGGVADVPGWSLGGVPLPMHVMTVLDVHSLLRTTPIDGILGNPLLAAADVRIDPDARTLTIAAPGTLAPQGAKLDVDTDRQLSDVQVAIDGVPARALFDTGDANELLLFQSFIQAHPGAVTVAPGADERGSGVGGSIATRRVDVRDLTLGPYHLYNRRAILVLSHDGAFADRNDEGNVGIATLRDFIVTFALSQHAVYLTPAHGYDDGRYRQVER